MNIEPEWIHLGKTADGVPINSYFLENPDMILGEMAFDASMYGNKSETTCNPYPDSDLAELLDGTIQNVHAQITEYERDKEQEQENGIPADPNVRYRLARTFWATLPELTTRWRDFRPNLNPISADLKTHKLKWRPLKSRLRLLSRRRPSLRRSPHGWPKLTAS